MKGLLKHLSICFSKDKDLYLAIKNIFGFWPGNIFLYKLALRHKSAALKLMNGEKLSNERLEFLGDAILDAVVAHYLFRLFPLRDEGFLTEMRSKIVSRNQLNLVSRKIGLNDLVTTQRDHHPGKSISGDAFEAFIGAMFIDKGYDFTEQLLINKILKVHFDIYELEHKDFNFKSKLIEWGQKEKTPVEFRVLAEKGSGHSRQYEVEVLIDHQRVSTAIDNSIKGAEQLAAEKAITALKEFGIEINNHQGL